MEPQAGNRGISAWKWVLLPWMAAVILAAYLWAKPLKAFMEPESARIIFWHVPMAELGLLWFWVGAYFAVRLLFGKQRGNPVLDRKVEFSNQIGLICTLLATITGMVFAQQQWGAAWNWDPKQVSITVLILIYLAYFGLRMSVKDPEERGRLSAVYAVIGAVSAPVLMFVIPQLPQISSLHPPGSTIAGGLDMNWRLIYWSSFFGFLGITSWIFQLRLRLADFEEALQRRAERAADRVNLNGKKTEAVREPALRR